ncbi:MAG: hypothetical protein JOY77_13855 [Alphaproteobacteria bacterium]|nr:hypothetical protein [Alphaproteobacteria bacterium]MBV9063993.1 hypothetical protein [Alphaproteobacteria bacterium]
MAPHKNEDWYHLSWLKVPTGEHSVQTQVDAPYDQTYVYPWEIVYNVYDK